MIEHVKIEFRGICTHFRNTVPGTPHRAVLPRSTAWQPGAFAAPSLESPFLYLLPPHFPYVYFTDGSYGATPQYFDAPGIVGSWIVAGVRLQIANAIGDALEYDDATYGAQVPRVADFVTQYRYSEDVAMGGRAACYFDVFRGSVSSYLHGAASRSVITIETDGPPRLQVTLLDRHRRSGSSLMDVSVGPYLVVGNSGLSCDDANVDFLWHYLTSEGSIPADLPRMPYGWDAKRHCTPVSHEAQFAKLLEHGYPGRLSIAPGSIDLVESEASCSNSQYP